MRAFRGLPLLLLIPIVILIISSGKVSAIMINIADQPDELIVAKIPPGLLDGFTPEQTPTPTESPEPEPTDVPEPAGYQLDGNDFFSVLYQEGVRLNLNGLEIPEIQENTVVRFSLKALGEAAPAMLYVVIRHREAGKFDLRFADYEPEQYQLSLQVQQGGGEKTYDLKSNSRVTFSALYMEAVLFDGETTPAAGTGPKLSVPISVSEKQYTVIAQKGDLLIELRQRPELFTPPSGSTPSTPPSGGNPSNPGPNPSTGVGDVPSGEVDVPRVNAQLGGSGLFSCNLRQGIPVSYSGIIVAALLAVALAWPAIRRFSRF